MADPNPITLRSPLGPGIFRYQHYDDNTKAALRHAYIWNPSDSYVRNQIVWWEGIMYVALADVAASPAEPWDDDGTNWSVFSPITGYGVMELETPTNPPNIGGGFQTLPFDTTLDIVPIGCTFDLPTDTFDIDYRGLWELMFSMSMQHNGSNQGRTFTIRLFNVTAGTPSTGVTVAIGRNAEGTNLAIPFWAPIGDSNIGDSFRVEIGNASQTISSVTYEYNSLTMKQIAANRPNASAGDP